ncbi:MAG: hypothetical protein KA767_04455 [Saprospiraceae bacterium]|nr:hypothetical protein [Saprospiraceae bacterium]
MIKSLVLVDTVSIQQYVFNSNKLQLNLGASHIVAHEIFDKSRLIGGTVVFEGGGNALLEFENGDLAKNFIKEYSLDLLLNFPGLKVSFGNIEGDLDTEDPARFKATMDALHKNLRENKQNHYCVTSPFKPGIVADCAFTEDGAASVDSDWDGKLLSAKAFAKKEHFEKGESELKKEFKEVLGNWEFPREFDKLGQSEGFNYIAVVHIDGNGVGKMFQDQKNRAELKNLSDQVKEIVSKVLRELLKEVVTHCEQERDQKDSKERYLAFRPIIVGGDDITFVCKGKLGLYLAKRFLELYKEQEIKGQKLEASAGICMVKTKFPFFKAYETAEDLLTEAKAKANEDPIYNQNNSPYYPSYMAYEIIGSGNSTPDLTKIFSMDQFNKIVELAGEFTEKNNWSKTKIMAFREVLSDAIENDNAELPEFLEFVEHSKMRKISFPTKMKTVDNLKNIYSAIEINEFYETLQSPKA